MRNTNSSGLDKLTHRCIKYVKQILVPLFTLVISQTLISEIVTDRLRIAKIKLLFKLKR